MKKITFTFFTVILTLGITMYSNAQYCGGGPTSSYDSNVEQVDISGEGGTAISHSSCGGPAGGGIIGVQDLTNLSVALQAGNTYTITITFGTCGSNYAGAGEAWLDWNQDFTFDPATESIGTSAGTPGSPPWNAPVDFNFTVPAGAGNGTTILRIMQWEGGSNPLNPCGGYSWGSVMDFSVNISGGTNICSFYPITLTASGITSSSADLGWTQYGSATTWNVEYGLAGFTQGTGTMITGTTNNPQSISGLTEATSYDFYVQTDCGGSQSSWSGSHTFSTLAACVAPTTLSATNITGTSADLGWNEAGTATTWNIEWGVTGFTQGTGTMITGTTSNPYNLTGLSASTTYDFYVQADCGGDQSAWSGSFSFTTACSTVSTFPYLEEFAAWPPLCWDLSGGSQTCVQYGGFCAEGSFWGWSTGQYGLMTTPILDVSSLTSAELLFDWSHLYNASYPNDQLEVLVSDDLGGTWTQIWNKTGTALNSNDGAASTTPGSFVSSGTIDLSAFGTNLLVRFNFHSGYGPDCFLDNVQIREAPTCLAPSDLTATNITAITADLGWIEYGTTLWNIEWGATGFTPGAGTMITGTTTNPHNLTGLSESTSYDFYVQADCGGGDVSFWVGPFTFSTTETCPLPTDLDAVVTDITADLSWNGYAASTWDIEWGPTQFIPTGTPTIEDVTANPYTLSGLTPYTEYVYYVRADCGAEQSAWAGPYAFTTMMTPLTNPTICGVGYGIVSNQCLDIPIDVTGVSGTQLGTDILLKGVKLIATHTYDADLDITLESPTGIVVLLTSDNGSSGDNFGVNDGTCSQYTNFVMCASTSITSGNAPFVGEYVPEGDFNSFNDGSDPNGIWILHICDDAGGDEGSFLFTELVFGLDGTEANIEAYSFAEQTGPATINDVANTVDITVGFGTDLTILAASFALTSCAVADIAATPQVSGVTANDFTNPVTYTITAEDGVTTENWVVTVTEAPINTETDILTYVFAAETAPAIIDDVAYTVDINVGWEADITNLVATFNLSYGAIADIAGIPQVSGSTPNDFTTPVIYTISAEDGTTVQDWTINVSHDTPPVGALCTNPIPIALPVINETGTTDGFGDNYDTDPCGTSYIGGDDIFYEFTVSTNGVISGDIIVTSSYVGMFVYDGCPDDPLTNCIASATSSSSNFAEFIDIPVTMGTYQVVISSWPSPQSVDFDFNLSFVPSPTDLDIVFPDTENHWCNLTASEEVQMFIKNVGGTEIPANDSIFTYYKIDDNSTVADTLVLSTNLAVNDTAFFTFTELADFSAFGTYNFEMWLSYYEDFVSSNDSLTGFIEHYAITVDITGPDTIIVTQGDLPYSITTIEVYDSYYWQNADGSTISTAPNMLVDTKGWYFVEVWDTIGCSAIDSVLLQVIRPVELTVFLEGAFWDSDMVTYLNLFGQVPLSHPYSSPPWNYNGTESVTSIPNSNVVDWVLIEVRDAPDAASATTGTILEQQAGFVLKDGSVVGIDGSSNIQFYEYVSQQMFIVIYHRNHLPVMSANPLTEIGGVFTYDFTDDANKAYGGIHAQKEIASGAWGMMAGDADGNGQIDNQDKNDYWLIQNGTAGYLQADYNMTAIVNSLDTDTWINNSGKGTQVPE